MPVKDAIEAGQIHCAFQPIVDLRKQCVFAYESLARSSAAEYPNPPRLLAAASEEGFLGQLGRVLRGLSTANCPHPLFLNIHPDEFDEQWLVRPDDPAVIHDFDVYLEITESVPLSHYRFCHSVLQEIRDKGIKVAVDDLGAGYSNLKYIADLAPDIVKLDRGLIAGLRPHTRQFRLVRSIVRLCEDLGARVVAEGIEDREEMSAVLETGAHFGQGYYLARPAPVPPVSDWAALLNVRDAVPA